MAREIKRRLYPLHAEAAELAARQQEEASARGSVAEAVADALPGARIEEQYRRTRITWQHDARPPRQQSPVQADSACAIVGASRKSVTADASGRSARVISMLAAFAPSTRE
ncbi:hypothetical protein [Streptomyces sp. NPDC003832]